MMPIEVGPAASRRQLSTLAFPCGRCTSPTMSSYASSRLTILSLEVDRRKRQHCANARDGTSQGALVCQSQASPKIGSTNGTKP